jgi:hypothetical protein
MFKKEFEVNGGSIIEKGNKLKKSFSFKKVNLTYVESATNRVSTIDIFSLLSLKLRSKEVIVFIRDIYIELFPEDYKSPRTRFTLIANKISNYILVLLSTKLAFPTREMGDVFFKKHPSYPKRNYFALPPGTKFISEDRSIPDFSKKIGLLYLGSTSYQNSGFESFINFSTQNKGKYNFYVLSGDINAKNKLADYDFINLTKVHHSKIGKYISDNNIAFGFHTRPRNFYDDVTFPIKVLDFISLQLPFFTEKHKPIVNLLGSEYKLFSKVQDVINIEELISSFSNNNDYKLLLDKLKTIANSNTYNDRYKRLFEK